MRILVCISGWDDADLLRGCLLSVAAQGWPVLYVDGAYRTYARHRPHWTDTDQLMAVFDSLPPELSRVIVFPDRGEPYCTEAAKKTAMLRCAELLTEEDDWLLILDTDERIEAAPGVLSAWLAGQPAAEWAYLNIYRPEPGLSSGYRVPRLIRARRGMEFHPPRDFDLHLAGERRAFLEGEPVPLQWDGRWADVPPTVARIRHERHLRSVERVAMSGSYIRVREGRGLEGDTRW